MENASMPLWLVVGESLVAPHAIKRFENSSWIFLDPNKSPESICPNNGNMPQLMRDHKRLGIRGHISHLNYLSKLQGKFSYVVDDIGLFAEEIRYSDFQKDPNSQCNERQIFQNLKFFYDFLKPEGMLTTSLLAIGNLTDGELIEIRKIYDIKYAKNAKPWKDFSFAKEEQNKCQKSFSSTEIWTPPESQDLKNLDDSILQNIKSYQEARILPLNKYKKYETIIKVINELIELIESKNQKLKCHYIYINEILNSKNNESYNSIYHSSLQANPKLFSSIENSKLQISAEFKNIEKYCEFKKASEILKKYGFKISSPLTIINSLVKLYSAYKGYGLNEIFKEEIGRKPFRGLHEGDFGDLILIKK